MGNIVNGKSKPSLETLEKIAKALNVEIWELFASSTNTNELTALIDYKGALSVLSKEFLSQFKTEADVSKFLKQLHSQVLEKMLEGELIV